MPEAKTFHFRVTVSGAAVGFLEASNALYEAGCEDATPTYRGGDVYVNFGRTSPSLGEAVGSAIRDIGRAGIGGAVTRIEIETG